MAQRQGEVKSDENEEVQSSADVSHHPNSSADRAKEDDHVIFGQTCDSLPPYSLVNQHVSERHKIPSARFEFSTEAQVMILFYASATPAKNASKLCQLGVSETTNI